MSLLDLSTLVLVTAGTFFYIAGTVGLIRFPNLLTRLHALTKADNLGLGLVSLGLLLQAPDLFFALQILLVWVVVMTSSVVSCSLLAEQAINHRRRRGNQ